MAEGLVFRLEEEDEQLAAKIRVIGLGGGGSNAVNRMIASRFTGVTFIVANTDAQALRTSPAPMKLQLGARLTGGLGAGSDPEVGRRAATEDREVLQQTLVGADMIFITAGMGGGTGTGAAPGPQLERQFLRSSLSWRHHCSPSGPRLFGHSR